MLERRLMFHIHVFRHSWTLISCPRALPASIVRADNDIDLRRFRWGRTRKPPKLADEKRAAHH